MDTNQQNTTENATSAAMKFCKHCGKQIAAEAIICPLCGCQIESLKGAESTPNIVINNSNMNSNVNTNMISAAALKKPKNKWLAFALCVLFGYFGAHKFYEGKAGMGILYLFTFGLLGIGWFIDCLVLLFKPNPYYV